MTLDMFMSQLKMLSMAIIAYLAGKGIFTPADATLATSIVTVAGPILVPMAWSAWSRWNTKPVPHGSTALDLQDAMPAPGTIVKNVTAKVVGALLFGIIVLGSSPLWAQNPPTKSPAINALASWADADLQAAIDLSGSIANLPDGVAQACWRKFQGVTAVLKQHPLPLTLKLASDIQAARLVAMAMNDICSDPNCSQVWNDLNNSLNALAVLPLPFQPASICAKIPIIKSTPITGAIIVAPNSITLGAGSVIK